MFTIWTCPYMEKRARIIQNVLFCVSWKQNNNIQVYQTFIFVWTMPLNPCPWVHLKHPIIVSKSATQTDISCYLGAWWLWHPTSNTRTMLLWYLAQLDRLSLSNFSTIRLQCAISCATLLAAHEGRQIKREVGSEERCEFNFMVY